MSHGITIVQIDGDSDDPFGPCWGVLDPRSPLTKIWKEMVGLDVLPITDAMTRSVQTAKGERIGFRVDHKRFTHDQLTLIIRRCAKATGQTVEDVFQAITDGNGLTINAGNVLICHDPEVGRQFWASIPGDEASKPIFLG